MICYFETKTEAVQFVEDIQENFPGDCLSITITPQGKYVVCSAPFVTDGSSEDTGEVLTASGFLAMQANT